MHQVDKKCDPKSVRHSKAQNVAYLNMPPNILSGASFANNKLHCTSASQPHKLRSYVRRRMRATHLSLVLLFLNTSYLVSLLYFYAPRFFAAKWWSTKVETDATGCAQAGYYAAFHSTKQFFKGSLKRREGLRIFLGSSPSLCEGKFFILASRNSLFYRPGVGVFYIVEAPPSCRLFRDR